MYHHKVIGVFILSILCVGIRCQNGEERDSFSETLITPGLRTHYHWPSHGYYHRRSCDTETQTGMSEVKSEIEDLQKLLVGLRQKLDPEFKLPPSIEPKCPPGFQYLSLARGCYKVVYEGHNWTSADQRCHEMHPEAYLVAITKSEENSALKSYLGHELAKTSHINVCIPWEGQGKMLWTSGQRLNETSCSTPFAWKISNDTSLPLSFAFWDPTEPNCHANKEQCIHIRPNRDFKWNDISCETKLCPVCEFDPL